ncbi:MAG: ribosome-associated protein [Halioglobus sp.]|jgi:ribosome-associated protein
MRDVEINREPVELYKILKFEGMVPSGGEAKMVVANGLVSVNGAVETRKRKKIVSGDVIEFNHETIRVLLGEYSG